jgi:hypothetical protein
MVHSPFWKANSHSFCQDIPHRWWKTEDYFLLPLFLILLQVNLFHFLKTFLLCKSFEIIHPIFEALHNISWHSVSLTARSCLPPPKPEHEDHPLTPVCGCCYALYLGRMPPQSATWGRAMPWWQDGEKNLSSFVKEKLTVVQELVCLETGP